MPLCCKCIILGCLTLQTSLVTLFKVPREDEWKKRWFEFVSCHTDGELSLTTNTCLCIDQFMPESFTTLTRDSWDSWTNYRYCCYWHQGPCWPSPCFSFILPSCRHLMPLSSQSISLSVLFCLCYNISKLVNLVGGIHVLDRGVLLTVQSDSVWQGVVSNAPAFQSRENRLFFH